MLCLVAQSCLTLFNPMDGSPPGYSFSVHGDSPGRNTGEGCHALLQRIFPTQGLNPDLPHCRQFLYCLSHHGSSRILEGAACPFSRHLLTQESSQALLHCRQILSQLSYQGSNAFLASGISFSRISLFVSVCVCLFFIEV